MTTTESVRAREVPRVGRHQAFGHRTAEIAAWHELLTSLDSDDWHVRTVCTEWDVADVVGHLCGQAEDVLVPWSFPMRDRRARRRYPDVPLVDSHMLIQSDEHRGTPPAELIQQFDRLWDKANQSMLRRPELIRRIKIKVEGIPIPTFQRLSFGYIQDILLPRDLWMHRDDVCRALGRPFDPGKFGQELIGQVLLDLEVFEVWAGLPVRVVLSGPAGGIWQLGQGEPVADVRTDAVGYMRTISGRDEHPMVELLSGDSAAVDAAAGVRMPF
jgi:uncharacterized protein (TIGR03083 family)